MTVAESGDTEQPSRDLLDAAAQLRWRIEQLEAEFLGHVAEIDRRRAYREDGAVSTVSWLKNHCRMDAGKASQLVTLAHAGESFPELREAQLHARITGCEARRIAQGAETYRQDLDRRPQHATSAAQTVGELQSALLHTAENGEGTAALRRQVDSHRHQLVADTMATDEWAAYQQRELHFYTTFDGMTSVRGTLDPISAATVRTAVESMTKPAADQLTPKQRRADALVTLAATALDGGQLPTTAGQRPHVHVSVSHSTLTAGRDASGTEPANLGGHGPVSGETARLIACDAEITPITHGTGSEVLDVGRASRRVSSALHKALRFRDGGCAFPGCDRPVEWCDAHHIVHWSHGGRTALDNLVLLCRRHHTEVHLRDVHLSLDNGVLEVGQSSGTDPPEHHGE